MKKLPLYGAVVILILAGFFVLIYIFLYNFNDEKISGFQRKIFYSWQNKEVSKLLASLASNSRIYKGYISYGVSKDLTKLPQDEWRGKHVRLIGTGAGTSDFYQGISSDTVYINAITKGINRTTSSLIVEANQENMPFSVDRSTLIYRLEPNRSIQLIGRGIASVEDSLIGKSLALLVLDEGAQPIIFEVLILNP